MKKTLVALGTLALTVSPAWAASTAGDLLAACVSTPGSSGDAYCTAYINGFVNGIFADQIAREEGHPVCIDNTNTAAVRDALVDFLRTHTAATSLPAGSVLGVAVERRYPCKN
jgi:hypothetical protein